MCNGFGQRDGNARKKLTVFRERGGDQRRFTLLDSVAHCCSWPLKLVEILFHSLVVDQRGMEEKTNCWRFTVEEEDKFQVDGGCLDREQEKRKGLRRI